MAFERLGGFLGNLKGLFKGADSPIVSEMSPGPSISKKAPPTQGFGTKSMDFLTKQMDRMEIPRDQRDAFSKNMYDWSRQVRNIESDDNPMAAAGSTTAKGVYQFTDPSVQTGLNRMQNMGFDNEFIQGIGSNPQEWNDEQADSMFLANMFSQTGSDKYLKGIGGGDEQARQDAYYQFHHTAPDEATKKRVSKMMPTFEDGIAMEQGSEAFNY